MNTLYTRLFRPEKNARVPCACYEIIRVQYVQYVIAAVVRRKSRTPAAEFDKLLEPLLAARGR